MTVIIWRVLEELGMVLKVLAVFERLEMRMGGVMRDEKGK